MAKVFAKIPQDQRPDADQVLRMRWILTWKIDPETEARKAKARAEILGYQDPLYETRPTASPRMTRATRQLFRLCVQQSNFWWKTSQVPFFKAEIAKMTSMSSLSKRYVPL